MIPICDMDNDQPWSFWHWVQTLHWVSQPQFGSRGPSGRAQPCVLPSLFDDSMSWALWMGGLNSMQDLAKCSPSFSLVSAIWAILFSSVLPSLASISSLVLAFKAASWVSFFDFAASTLASLSDRFAACIFTNSYWSKRGRKNRLEYVHLQAINCSAASFSCRKPFAEGSCWTAWLRHRPAKLA